MAASIEKIAASATILVAEDDVVNAENTLRHLAGLGLVADLAQSGEEVLQKWSTRHYDVVLMDCQMPKMDGYTATREIRRLENVASPTVIIALTALDTPLDRQNCLASGMNDVLTKPIDTAQLAHCLQHWLGARPAKEGDLASSAADFAAQLIPIFLLDAPTRIDSMQKAFAENDSSSLERAAHTLRSSSGLLGAQSLSRQCEILENRGHNGSWQDVESVLEQLKYEFNLARHLLEAKLNGGDSSPAAS